MNAKQLLSEHIKAVNAAAENPPAPSSRFVDPTPSIQMSASIDHLEGVWKQNKLPPNKTQLEAMAKSQAVTEKLSSDFSTAQPGNQFQTKTQGIVIINPRLESEIICHLCKFPKPDQSYFIRCSSPITALHPPSLTSCWKETKCNKYYCIDCLIKYFYDAVPASIIQSRLFCQDRLAAGYSGISHIDGPPHFHHLVTEDNWICPHCLDLCNCTDCRGRRIQRSSSGVLDSDLPVYRREMVYGMYSVHLVDFFTKLAQSRDLFLKLEPQGRDRNSRQQQDMGGEQGNTMGDDDDDDGDDETNNMGDDQNGNAQTTPTTKQVSIDDLPAIAPYIQLLSPNAVPPPVPAPPTAMGENNSSLDNGNGGSNGPLPLPPYFYHHSAEVEWYSNDLDDKHLPSVVPLNGLIPLRPFESEQS